ncbi:MAG: hypothetical protein WAW81_01640, partial [Minisyncoccia bacterium]
MKEGFPKFEATEQVKSGKEFKEQLRERLLDLLDPVLNRLNFDTKEIQTESVRLREAQQDARQLSLEAGEFFRSLIPEGLRKPEVEGVPKVGSFNWIMGLEHIETYKLHSEEVKKLSRKEYGEQKKYILRDSLHGRERVPFEGEVKEIERPDGEVDQVVMNALEQDGGQNLIYERVSNT